MADADALILTALQQSDCLDTIDPSSSSSPSSWSVRDLNCDALVAIVCQCLARIQSATAADDSSQLDFQLPPSFDAPVGVAARHRVGSQLANILKDLGYAGDCGYNHFLYPSEKETRNILTWLVGKLPRTATESALDEVSALSSTPSVSGQLKTSSSSNATQPASASLLSSERLQSIFSSWKQEKTLYVLPNRELRGLRGFQSLSLKTSSVSLPWQAKTSGDEAKEGFLFDALPSDSLKASSLLEALTASQRRNMHSTSLYDDEDVEERVGRTTSASMSKKQISGGVKKGARDPALDVEIPDEATFMAQGDSDDEEDTKGEFAIGKRSPEADSIGDLRFLPSVESLLGSSGTLKEQSPAQPVHRDLRATASDGSVGSGPPSQAEDLALTAAEEQELLETMHAQLVDTQQRISKMRKVIERDHKELHNVQVQIDESKKRGLDIKRSLATRQQTFAMLPQAKENIAKLESICADNAAKLQQLEAEWEAHRAPLLKEEARLVAMKSNRKARCRQFVAEMKTFRQEMKDMAAVIQEKMDSVRILDKSFAQLPQNLNRNMYTARIMEIIKQVHKQKAEISKIIDDIKSIQKQLNFASEKLKRSEAVAEDKLYSAASAAVAKETQNSPFVECYRKFAEVRELFEELIIVVGDVGKKENAARDLENWISQLQNRDSGRHLDKVLTDLESVQMENSALVEQLRAQTA